MKKLLFLLLLPFSVFAQTNFGGATGIIIRNSTPLTLTNSASTDQTILSSTVKGGSMTIDRPYAFTCDLSLTTPAISLATLTFKAKLGANVLTFVSASGLTANLSGSTAGITITGYVVKRANGDLLVKYGVSPTGATSVLALNTTNTTQFAVWSGVDTSVDNTFTVTAAFGTSLLSTTTLTRQYYARSEF